MKAAAVLVLLAAIGTEAIELTKKNWDKKVAGKSVFIKFLAPWCGHCKKLKPDWDRLMKDFKKSKTALVADVDCTAGGKELCEEVGVQGYPTIKYGDPNNLEDYEGGRSYEELKKFADENLGPQCGPNNLDLCSEEKKALVEKFMAMSDADLEAGIKEKQDAIETEETTFKTLLEGLQKQYEEANKLKDANIADIKASGLGLMKAVKASRKTAEETPSAGTAEL